MRQRQTTPVSESQLSAKVVEHVRGRIERGELRPGDRLEPERELAQRLHISRSSLRAGISMLSSMGVLKSRRGAGTFVSDGPASFHTSSLNVMAALHGFNLAQMFEARLTIEKSLAALAALRASHEHKAAMAEEVADMYASLEEPQEYLIHDVRFHRTIAAASGNPILAALMETIAAALYERRRLSVDKARDLKQSADMHRELFRAIRSGNSRLAGTIMEQHLNATQIAQEHELAQEGNEAEPLSSPASLPHSPTDY